MPQSEQLPLTSIQPSSMFRTALLVAFVAVTAYLLVYLANGFGLLRHFHKHHPGKCRKLNPPNVHGSEDFSVTSDGLAFITSGLFIGAVGSSFNQFLERKNVKGKMLLFDLKKPDSEILELKLQSSETFDAGEFRPHGISLLEDKVKGEHLLYVVSHPIGHVDRIEKFRYLPSTQELRHERSFFSEQFLTLNDLAIIEEDVFYVTNYMYFKKMPMNLIEHIAPLSLGNVLYFNDQNYTPVLTALNGANGVTLSTDRRFLYVNFPFEFKVRVYFSSAENRSLTLLQEVTIHTCADNLHESQSGDAMFVGAHPIGHLFKKHFSNPDSFISPSQVLRLPLKHGLIQEEEITELFYDHGELISGSSIATVYNKQLLIGSVIHNLAICDLTGPTEV